jgi:putative phosphoribosyl transferase
VRALNRGVIDSLRISRATIEAVSAREEEELSRRDRLYVAARTAPEARDRIVILIDDGLATGSTMRAAVLALQKTSSRENQVAAAPSTCDEFQTSRDRLRGNTPIPSMRSGPVPGFFPGYDEQVREMLTSNLFRLCSQSDKGGRISWPK